MGIKVLGKYYKLYKNISKVYRCITHIIQICTKFPSANHMFNRVFQMGIKALENTYRLYKNISKVCKCITTTINKYIVSKHE
jgi:hypothetical protein